ncbi:glucokinase [Aidingimonas halophila]|uniref:Glucokinase n=1 Tax=Aidingimonas halophila TaxID=574349 RepID=A0A1H2S382_9GAMM|nr:glucokinase [Aidingimonas halophila]GHC18294.1 glucokinase [Aidingimonas halophila]SDW26162.1 glucokinase [Aidingimonas halophila]
MTRPALIGDIGGTNARFALVRPDTFAPYDIQTLPCADYPSLIEAVQEYLGRLGLKGDSAPREACLAFACPIDGDRVKMTNNHWAFSRREVQHTLGLDLFKIINDFTAQALGVPHVEASDLVPVGDGQPAPHSARLVIGPGTGLGVAGVFPGQHAWIPLPAEGGHVTFAPTDEREQNLLRYFQTRYGRVSVERILCGQGLLDLYRAHASLKGANPKYDTPADVTTAATEGDAIAVDTVQRFLKILGDVCGDAALTLGARGGVYLCGGILPRLLDWLPTSRFRAAFADKGRMSAYNAAIPTWVVTAPWTGLLGAAEALHNEEVA